MLIKKDNYKTRVGEYLLLFIFEEKTYAND